MADACKITVLETQVVEQIAAGEVVERPASAVKELVENALDASATRVEVQITDGGRSEIRIVDDGDGMSEEEAKLCLRRHATSKLRSAADLATVSTLGFRGEGLSSIAAVSRLTLTTRRADSDSGVELQAEGGRVLQIRPTGCPVGSAVRVRDLFFNTPARSKFLKSTATETGHITDIVNRVALAFPQVHVNLRQGSRIALELPARRDRLERARDVLGQPGSQLVAAESSGDWLRVQSFICPVQHTVATARSLVFIVNRRAVRDRMLMQAVLSACERRAAAGRYPIGVVYLDIAPDAVDVNVHPQKTEVRFADPRAIHRLVRETVLRALEQGESSVQPARVYRLASAATDRPGRAQEQRLEQASRRFWEPAAASPGGDLEPDDYGLAQALARIDERAAPVQALEAPSAEVPRLVGVLFERVLICEWGSRVLLLDRVVGWRRVVEAELTSQLDHGPARSVQLEAPLQLELGPRQSEWVADQRENLRRVGFVLDPFGGASWLVRAVPAPLFVSAAETAGPGHEIDRWKQTLEELIPALVASLREVAADDSVVDWAAILAPLVAAVARKRGELCTPEELIEALGRLEDPAWLDRAEAALSSATSADPAIVTLRRADLLRRLCGDE